MDYGGWINIYYHELFTLHNPGRQTHSAAELIS